MVSYAFIIMVLSDVTATLTSSRVVHTKYGDVTGVIVTPDSRFLDAVEIFRGIPYASPPIGNLRFMPPVTGALWSGVKLADKFSPVCPQRLPDIANETVALKRMPRGRLNYLKRLMPYLQNQSEDCLYLNIYVPAQVSETNRKYPVLVFVHGESYEWNSGNPYDGSVLASYGGLLVVTINYRLGLLGFLNTNLNENLKSPSNYGLMDQIAALHWLQENVSVFGGDPSNVTLLGHGTGAACVNFLMTSSAVPDGLLFHRAILMSGSSLSPWALVKDPQRYTKQVTDYVNCSIDLSQSNLLKCLRSRPLELFLDAPVDAPEFTNAFGPSIDGVVIDTDLVEYTSTNLDDDLIKLAESYKQKGQNDGPQSADDVFQRMMAKLSRYDLMLGIVPAESFTVFTADDIQYGIEADRRSKILRTFIKNIYRYHLTEILATIINEYTDWERPVQHPVTIRDGTLEALTDAEYAAPILQIADFHSSARRNSYLYVFEYQTKAGDYQQRQGCVHGEELPYVFGAPFVGGLSHFSRNYTKAEMFLSEATMTYWSNFVKTGTPNNPVEADAYGARQEKSRVKNIEWIAYENVHKKYLILDMKPKLKNHYRAHKLSFWLNLVPELHRSGSQDMPRSHHMFKNESDKKEKKVKLGDEDDDDTQLGNDVQNLNNGLAAPPPIIVVAQSSSNHSHGSDPEMRTRDESYPTYSTALIVTVVVGCSLLLLNILVFVAVYYRERSSRRRNKYHQNCSSGRRKRYHENCDSSCSVSNTSSLKDTPDICSKIEKPLVENGGVKRTCGTGSSNVQQTVSKTSLPLTSILKSSQPLPSSNPSPVLILQPSRHLMMGEEKPIELSNFTFSASAKSSTLPRLLPPPRDARTSDTSTSSFSHSYLGGTLNRYPNSRSNELEDLRV